MPNVYVVVADTNDDSPGWGVVGVSATLDGAQAMALEFFDAFDDAQVDPDDTTLVVANGGLNCACIYPRSLEVPENGFGD